MTDFSLEVIALQHNPTVGDVEGNAELVLAGLETVSSSADLVVTPELALLGYPPRDLLHRTSVLEAESEAVNRIRGRTANEGVPAVALGHTVENDGAGPPLENAVSVFAEGKLVGRYSKQLLPTYDVFDEHRYFSSGDSPRVVEINGAQVGLTICEDAWYDHEVTGNRRHAGNPLNEYKELDVDLLVNLSASPFRTGKPEEREARFSSHAESVGAPVVFVNQVGGNDDIVFDGNSFVVDSFGSVRACGSAFSSGLLSAVVRTDQRPAVPQDPTRSLLPKWTQLRRAIELGIEDYVRKTGFETVVVGLSGGIDSSVTATLATEAVGSENVIGVTLPSRATSEETLSDARELAERLDIELLEQDISDLDQSLVEVVTQLAGESLDKVTRENIVARIRGLLLMGIANQRDALVLTPDNKSEAAVGYCTLYGDTVGAIAPLGDCTKQRVYGLAYELNSMQEESVIPETVVAREPTAELSYGQTDKEEIPAYGVIDEVVAEYVSTQAGVETVSERTGYSRELVEEVIRRLVYSEFKRNQTPPALRVTNKAFDSGWRYPIAAEYTELF